MAHKMVLISPVMFCDGEWYNTGARLPERQKPASTWRAEDYPTAGHFRGGVICSVWS